MTHLEQLPIPPAAKKLLPLIDWQMVLWMLAIKALVFGFAAVSVRTLLNEEISWWEMWNRWDALHYRLLAQFGYSATGEERFSLVFFPLYPWLVRFGAIIWRDYFAAAVAISGIASIAAGLLLQKLTRLDHSIAISRQAVWFLFIFPTSYFLHIGYTESLFLALVIGSLLAARKDRWALAGLLGAGACLTRVNGLILLPVLAVEAWQRYRETRRINWSWLWIGAAGLGFAIYLWLNYHVTGDFFMFSKIMAEHWHKEFTPPWIGIRDLWLRFPDPDFTESFHELFYVVLGLLCTVWCWVKLRPSYATWMTCNWLLINSTSFVLSVPRYTLTFFPIFILFARLAVKQPRVGALVTVWSLLSLGLFVSKFVQGTWAF
ncbi:MAG: hypothetical protein ABR589_01805 [Chthoniobacterales bacterium]